LAKTLIDNGASLNHIMRKTFFKIGLNLSDLIHVHDMFHEVIPGQLCTPIRRIDLEEILTFEEANFHTWNNCVI
jgi:hypothetical protein